MGGTVEGVAAPGAGTEFIVRLTLAFAPDGSESDEAAQTAQTAAAPPAGAPDPRKRRGATA